MPVSAIIQQDASRGCNLVTNPYVEGKQQSIILTNLLLSEHGSLQTRDGTISQTTAPDTRPIVKLFDFIRPDGTIVKLALVLTAGGNNQLYRRDTVPWTLIGALGTDEPLPDMLQFTGRVLIVMPQDSKIVVEGVQMIKRHTRPNPAQNIKGGILEREGSIHVSNVMLACPSCGPIRPRWQVLGDGKKVRACRKCGNTLD